MIEKLLNPELIVAAAGTNLGTLSLMCILLCLVVLVLFRTVPLWGKLTVFFSLLLGITVFGRVVAQQTVIPIEAEKENPQSTEVNITQTDSGPHSPFNQAIAQASCTALRPTSGWIFAVPRECSSQVASCDDICSSLKNKDPQVPELVAFNALHIYGWNEPAKQVGTLGLKSYKYNGTSGAFCGPNYCCCGNQ